MAAIASSALSASPATLQSDQLSIKRRIPALTTDSAHIRKTRIGAGLSTFGLSWVWSDSTGCTFGYPLLEIYCQKRCRNLVRNYEATLPCVRSSLSLRRQRP